MALREAINDIGQVARNLGHEGFPGIRSRSREVDLPAPQIDHEKDVVGHQTAWRPDLGREEVHSGDLTPMSLQERLPGRGTVGRAGLIPLSFSTRAIVLGATQ